MSSPRVDLPFFAYGTFKPSQLGFLRLRELVERSELDCYLPGVLLERDGLPILDGKSRGEVKGALLFFGEEEAEQAYQRISDLEPWKHYRWGTERTRTKRGLQEANVLFGRSPRKGSNPIEKPDWDGREDPLFTSALEVVQETIEQNEMFDWDLKPLFRLQMAYLLLWSAIERYVSLRYHLGYRVTEKVNQMADETAFVASLRESVEEERKIYRADRPSERVRLDPSEPKQSLMYYYQIRSNITHRGKAAVRDFDTLRDSLKELNIIFRRVLNAAFEDAKYGS